MISNDVVALVQLDPPGIELCRVSNIQNEKDGDTNNWSGKDQCDGPRMDKLCILLFPLKLRSGVEIDVFSAAFCFSEHSGHQPSSCGPWPGCRFAPLGHRRMLRQKMGDSIVSINLKLQPHVRTSGRELWPWSQYPIRWPNIEFVVHCATLLAYADAAAAIPTTAVTADSSTGDEDGLSVSAQADSEATVGDVNADDNAKGRADDGDVPWDAWGPQVTAMFEDDTEQPVVDWINISGERRATIEHDGRVHIQDYNPYRIRQARASMNGPRPDAESHEGKGNARKVCPNGTREIIEGKTIQGKSWLEEDVTTRLPYLETVLDVPGCRAVYMEQNQVLLSVRDVDKVSIHLVMCWIAFGSLLLSDNRRGVERGE